jgi:arginine/lysine/ornithine decarboxylase
MSLLTEKIDEYLAKDFSLFHSPAHCGYLGSRDLSEVEGLDDLQNPSGVLNNAQNFLAELFGAQRSFFLVNGASLGMQVACLALKLHLQEINDKRPILVARNIHKSTISGIILAGLDIEWFEPDWDENLGVYTRFKLTSTEMDCRVELRSPRNDVQSYSALIVTNPTYEGFYSELPLLDIPVIVDEAHGAHYHFSDQLPKPALDSGTDIVVQSWHKTLGSMTQTGVMHLGKKSRINSRYIQACLNLLQTTSPSYILLESLCKTVDKYARAGKEIIERSLNYAQTLDLYRDRKSVV